MNSIRQRLLFWQITALIVTGTLGSVLTYQLAWNAFNRIRDYGLEQIAYSVVRHGVRPQSWPPARPETPPTASPPPGVEAATGAPDSAGTPPDGQAAPEGDAEEDAAEDLGQFVSQIWSPAGEILYTSLESIGPPLQVPGFHMVQWEDEAWRIYTVADKRQIVQVAVTSSDRASSFAELVPWLLVPLGLLVLLLSLLIHTAVTKALAPLESLGRDIRRRDVKDLHPLETEDMPEELVPLGQALNQLLGRVDGLLASQRRVLADAAHELNTPLAAVKLQAQLARRSQEGQRDAALDELDRGIERSTHLVAQLLQMARLEPDVRERQPAPVRFDRLAAEVVAAFSAQAEAREIDLGLETSDAATVFADPLDMRVLLDNLVDNALRHTPPGSRVDIRVEQDAECVNLTVNDNGPGIAEADRQRVLERFVRLNPQDATGSGLGLAIVANIVQQNGGLLTLVSSPPGGLSVRVSLSAHQEVGRAPPVGSTA